MQRRTKSRHARRRALQQIDLFAGEPQQTVGDTPVWSGLPPDIQAALTSLITRLILEHAEKSRVPAMAAEAGHDL